ncbi:kinesin-like protein KIF21A isoform X5 [Mytilus edulis]|uniref:kinesin-like protein KIF21A isoform X5 n=1 Tax=Mytilus edulis TaxID=6550 RepID=UPI0039EFBCE3
MTEKKETKEDDSSVRVALRIRPQLAREKIDMCQICSTVLPEDNQVLLGKDKAFTFDYVYDLPTKQDAIYNSCVRNLIDGCFEGYNATVFAYGQTGSGKTYTMGTGFDVNHIEEEIGIVPRAVDHLFKGIAERQTEAIENNQPPPDFKITAQFIELYNEEILDLLDTTRDPDSRGRKSHIKIHEDAAGGIYMVGVTTQSVGSLNDTMQLLQNGALSRATASTNMNVQSSRSHAIFTLHVKQHRMVPNEPENDDDNDEKESDSTQGEVNEFETLTAKFHFVDLAGSERLKRTGATGDRAKEGISINCGLLALGNVISALGDMSKKSTHVPYRDSKLTRLLQDSLGGNSRTLMIACISPSDRDFIETLNTLKYANRARNIKNKVIANQDKASKQLAILRTEITQLQLELLEYKTGKRTVNEDGVETVNDMILENTMLQTENDKLRQRLKALNEVIDSLKTQNTQLIAEKAALGITNISEDARAGEVTKMIENYIQEIEDLRSKLVESEAMALQLKKRNTPVRMSAMSPMMSPISMASSLDICGSPAAMGSSVLLDAKKDLKKLRKMKKSKVSRSLSEKENVSDNEKEQNEAEADQEMKEEVNGENEEMMGVEEEIEEMDEEDDDDEELDDLDESSDDSDSEDKVEMFLDYWLYWADSDNIHEDLAELTCEISIKQKLVEELEQSQKRLHSVRQQYEDKVVQLVEKIKSIEMERDTILSNIGSIESQSSDKVKKVKVEYDKKLTGLQNDLKKLQAAKKEHAKMLKNQSHYEKQLKTLQHELAEMKKTKVKLMKQVKEEADRNKQSEARRNKEVAQLKRDQIQKENRIRNLEKEKKQKETVLKRKVEEVESLRKRNKPMSVRTAGRIGRYDRPATIPISNIGVPVTSSPRRRRRGTFSAKAAKQKWDAIEKNISSVITKKQTISNMEKDMEIWLKQREKTCKKREKYMKKREGAIASGKEPAVIKDLNDVIEHLSNQVLVAQENITECQANVMQMEETKDEAEVIDVATVVNKCGLDEAQYLLEHFIQMSITKGVALSQKDAEIRELQAQLHQTELNNTLQQDLLKHMINDRVDIEVDNLMTNATDGMLDLDSSTDSSSSSPAESMFESKVSTAELPGQPTGGDQSKNLSKDLLRRPIRRKTATPEELLYPGSSEGIIAVPQLQTLHEEPQKSLTKVNGHSDNQLMPPPVKPPPKNSSTSNLPRLTSGSRADPGPSPSLRRKEFPKPSPDPSPVLKRKNYSGSNLITRSSSVRLRPNNSLPKERPKSADVYLLIRDTTTSSDTTPPSSPTLSRRARVVDDNVFSRLTSNTQPPSLNPPNRGNIVPNPNTGKITMTSGKPAPVTCTHMAEGHSKAVLSVYATDDLLFTSSKDRTAKAWDLQTGKEVMSFAGHPNNVLSVKYNELLNLVFTVSQSYINVWDYRMNATQCIKTLSSSGLTHDGPVNFQSGIRQSELPPGEHNINDIALGCDGYTLYSATGSMVRVWDLTTFSAIGKLNGGHQAAVMVLAVEQQKDNDVVITGSKDHYIKIFEVTDDKAGVLTPKYNLEPPHYDGIQSLAIKENILFSGSRDTCIKKWDLKTHTLKQSINQAHKDWICGLSFIPDSNIVLSGCRGGYLKLWNVDNCHCMGEVKAHTSPINAIATNGSAIFTASNDSAVKIWQFNRIQTLTTLWESGGPNPDWKPRTHQLSSPKSKNYMYKRYR